MDFEAEFDTDEDKMQYERFMAKHSPKKFQQYMKMKERPAPPNFEDGGYEPADDAIATATPIPAEGQTAVPPTLQIDAKVHPQGGDLLQMMHTMHAIKSSCDAMEAAVATKDRQIAELMAALSTQKQEHDHVSSQQTQQMQQLQMQMQRLMAAAADPTNDTGIHDVPIHDELQIQDADNGINTQNGADVWEPVKLSTGDVTNQFDELVVSLVLPSSFTSDRKDVFDVPSLADYILKKRPDIKTIFKNDDDTGHVLIQQTKNAAAKVNATVRTLSSAGKILTVMQIMAITGDDDRRGDIQMAVEAALLCDAGQLQKLIHDVKAGNPLHYDQTNEPIACTRGMQIIIQQAAADHYDYIKMIYDLLMGMLAAESRSAHDDAMAALRSIKGSLPRHQIRYEQECFEKATRTLGPDASDFWTTEQRMTNLINARNEPNFRHEFYNDLFRSDRDWRRMSWHDITSHFEKIALRMALNDTNTPDSKPTKALGLRTPTQTQRPVQPDNDKDNANAHCDYHGSKKGHDTQECSLYTHWDPDVCESYREHGLCFFHAAGRCHKGDACKNKHADETMIEDLGNPLRDKPVPRPFFPAIHTGDTDEIGPRPDEPPRRAGKPSPLRSDEEFRASRGLPPSRSFNMIIPQEYEDEYHAAEAKALYAVESDCDY